MKNIAAVQLAVAASPYWAHHLHLRFDVKPVGLIQAALLIMKNIAAVQLAVAASPYWAHHLHLRFDIEPRS